MSYPLPFTEGDRILELGGGSNSIIKRITGLEGFNVDIRQVPGVDAVRNLEEDFSDLGQFDGLFAQYVAEHISWRKIEVFFKSCYNALKPDGMAVFVVPDTYGQIKKILQKKPEEIDLGDSNFLFGGQDYSDNVHKTFLSKPFITKLLRSAGFSEVKITDHPNPDARDMFVEAHKRGQPTILSGAIADTDTKINFGSFTVTFGHGWINADIRADIKQIVEDKGHIFEYCDVTKPLRWEDNSVSVITAHHLIEHLSREEGASFLEHTFRILKHGGVIRLSTPDLDTFIAKLPSFKETYAEEFEVKNAEDSVDAFFRLAFMGHKTIYTYPSLRRKMAKAGFVDVKKMPYGASRSVAVMEETEDAFPDHSFYIEAIKPQEIISQTSTEEAGWEALHPSDTNTKLSLETETFVKERKKPVITPKKDMEALRRYLHDDEPPLDPDTVEVSIIVLTVNSPTFEECIQRIKEKTKIPYELIVVCDLPNKEKRERLGELEAEGANIIVNKIRMGVPAAFNMGMREAKGQYVLLTHDDVFIETDGWLRPLVEALKNHPEFGYVSAIIKRPKDPHMAFGEIGECSLMTKDVIRRVGFYDESDLFKRLAADGDYFVRVKRAGYKPHGVIKSFVTHLLGTTIKDELERKDIVDNMEELYRRYGKKEIHIDRRLLPVYHGEEMLPSFE